MPSVRTRLPAVAPAARWSATSSSSRSRRWSWTRTTGSGVVSSRRSSRGPATRAALGDRVEERPRRVRHDLGDQRPDVVLGDRVERPVERELLELAHGERALALAVDVALADEPADAPRELLRRARPERDLALVGAGLDPGRQLALARRLERLRVAARLHAPWPRGPGAPRTAASRRRPVRGTRARSPARPSPIAWSIASRSALDRRSGAGSTMTATVPPPNSGAVATRMPIAAASVSAPFARQRSGRRARLGLEAPGQRLDGGVHRVAVVAPEVGDDRDVGAHAAVSRRARRDQRRRSTWSGRMPAAAQTSRSSSRACRSASSNAVLAPRRAAAPLGPIRPEPGGYLRRHRAKRSSIGASRCAARLSA